MLKKIELRLPKMRGKQLISYMLIFVIIPVANYLIGKHLDKWLSLQIYPPFPFNLVLGFGVFFFGLMVGIRATQLIYKKGGGLPWGEAKKEVQTERLVTEGLYAYTRNPMVLGYSLLPFGMGLMFQSLGMTLSMSPIVLFVNVAIIKLWEEPNLKIRFGKKYEEYRERTPFLIPRDLKFIESLVDPENKRFGLGP